MNNYYDYNNIIDDGNIRKKNFPGNLRNRVKRLCQLVLLSNSQVTKCVWYLLCVNKTHKSQQYVGYVVQASGLMFCEE